MLVVFYGTDPIVVRQKAHEFIDRSCESGVTDRMTYETYIPGALVERAGSASLFGGVETILLDTLSFHKDAWEEFLEALPACAESPHTFVVIEEKLLADATKKIKKHASVVEQHDAAEQNERFNTFALADALVRKDKKSLWVLLQRARHAGVGPEEIIGTLFWQLKSLRLAEKTDSAAEAGLKPFVYTKAVRARKEFKPGELEKLSHELLAVYHDGHQGRRDIDLALEKFVLTL